MGGWGPEFRATQRIGSGGGSRVLTATYTPSLVVKTVGPEADSAPFVVDDPPHRTTLRALSYQQHIYFLCFSDHQTSMDIHTNLIGEGLDA